MPILLCFKKTKVAMYRRLSEARNLTRIRSSRPAGFRGSSPRFASGKCLRHFPRSSAGAGVSTRSLSCPDDLQKWEFPLQPGLCTIRQSTRSEPDCLDRSSVRPAPSVSGVWQLSGCPVLPDSSFQTLAIGPDHSARKPRAAVPSARGSMSTPLFFVEKTAGSSAWSSDMVGRTAWIPPDGQTAPPATPKLELPSNLTRKGCTKTCLFWPAETTNLFRHNLLAPCGCLLE